MRNTKISTYFILFILLLFGNYSLAQHQISGEISDLESGEPIKNVSVSIDGKKLYKTDKDGFYKIKNLAKGDYLLTFFHDNYRIEKEKITVQSNERLDMFLTPIIELSEIEAVANKKQAFDLRRMKDIEGTSILAGKKNEVVLVSQMTANKSTNNARQIYSQVVGLNIFDYNDGGLQLGIGGRGLNPNRTANFNTRQNGYDISADVLGYPESYYTPPTEALEEIQIIRGAASLQYGTQFGGLVNFIFKKPNPYKKFEFLTRNTIGSNNLFTSFNSVSGTNNKLGYYAFYNHKQGKSFRPNSNFKSNNFFANFEYKISEKTKINGEFTKFYYLAQQAGGLTDYQFYLNPNFSNRARNWFDVDWNLADINIEHEFSKNSLISTHFFWLKSHRKSLGFRPNRISQEDEEGQPRDLIVGEYGNFGFESRYLQHYKLFNKNQAFLVGIKYYNANNKAQQGPGSRNKDADFNFDFQNTPDYPYQSYFDYPNKNIAVFGEAVFKLSDEFSVTPGFRYEWLNTQAKGFFREVILDLSGNVISNKKIDEKVSRKRNFPLLGLGLSYKKNKNFETYANFSQNYKSVTFNDIHTVNPNFIVSKSISDEKGYTSDLGIRGNYSKLISYDINGFLLRYQDRIGDYIRENDGKRERDNIGDAIIYGLEFFADLDIDKMLRFNRKDLSINLFLNLAWTKSEYISSKKNNVTAKKVEFIPELNLKSGIGFGYRNLTTQLLFTHVTEQFTDATNSKYSDDPINGGIKGEIPAYSIMDFSAAYRWKRFKLEAGINNLLNSSYFVRRASGYPGPGIIPSDLRTFYATLEIKIP